jgi:hypothetical protein
MLGTFGRTVLILFGACCLSADQPFMRDKDFFLPFFERLPCTISDLGSTASTTTYWRRVDDMRRLLPDTARISIWGERG